MELRFLRLNYLRRYDPYFEWDREDGEREMNFRVALPLGSPYQNVLIHEPIADPGVRTSQAHSTNNEAEWKIPYTEQVH